MAIHVDVFTRVNERRLRQDTDQIASTFEAAGLDAGNRFARGLDRSSPKVAKAMDRQTDIGENLQRHIDKLNKLLAEEEVNEKKVAEQAQRVAKAYRDEARAIAETTRAVEGQTAANKARRAVWDELETSIDASRRQMEATRGSSDDMTNALNNQYKAAERLNREHAKLTTMWRSGQSTADQYRAQIDRVTAAFRDQEDATRSVQREHDLMNRKGQSVFTGLIESLNNLGRSTVYVARGLGTLGLPAIIGVMADILKVTGEATKSFWLMPAALAATAAAAGTLKLAFSGFDDIMGNLDDPDKFAEAIQKLSPAAQQAALTIRALVQGPLKDLQQATQEAAFQDVAPMLQNLASAYAPAIQDLTTSIAGSFNNMFTDIGGMLLEPGTKAQIEQIFDNISTFFSNITPAATSFSRALIDITDVGAQFLPLIGRDLATAAANFASFISEARQSGELKQWIADGYDALKSLMSAVWQLTGAMKDLWKLFTGGSGAKDFESDMRNLHSITSLLVGDFDSMNASLTEINWGNFGQEAINALGLIFPGFAQLDDALGLFKDQLADIPEIMAAAFNGAVGIINKFIKHINDSVENSVLGKILKMLGVDSVPNIPTLDMKMDGGNWAPWGQDPPPIIENRFDDKRYSDSGPDATPAQTWVDPKTGTKMVMTDNGWMPEDQVNNPTNTYGGPMDVPAPPPGTGDTPKFTAPKEQWSLDNIPIGSFPGEMPVGAPLPGTTAGSGTSYGLAPGTDIDYGASGFPPWVYALGQQFGLQASTYDGHQEGSGSNQGIDWSGPVEKMQQFAEYLTAMKIPGLEQVIWQNPNTKQPLGLTPGGEVVDQTGGYYNDDWAGHQDHVHTRFGSAPNGMPTPGPSPYGSSAGSPYGSAGGGYRQVDQRKVTEAQWEVDNRKAAVEEKRRRVLELQADNNSSEDDILRAQQDVTQASQEFQKAQWDLIEAQQGTLKKGTKTTDSLSSMFGELGVALDSDLGLSRGLPGLAENLIKFVGSLAAAPMLGPLAATQAMNPIQGGHGLLGMLGAKNIAATGNPLGLPGGPGSAGQSPFGPQAGQAGATIPPEVLAGLDPNVARWGPMASQVLQRLGLPQEYLGPMMKQIATESGGNPSAINLTDSNAAAGHPSQGLLQTIPSTFQAFLPPGFNPDINDPMSSMAAGASYANQKPGGIPGNWGFGEGYAKGGAIPIMAHAGEHVLTKDDVAAMGGQNGVYAFRQNLQGFANGGGINEYGGVAPYSNPAGGGAGMTSGGPLDMAAQAGAMALDAMAPGAGQAASMGIKLANRAIQYGASVGGIAAGGLMETFLPFGASELANNNWLTRIAGGFAGMAPALPNMAGTSATTEAMQQQEQQAAATGAQAGVMVPPPTVASMAESARAKASEGNIAVEYHNHQATEDRAGKDLTHQLGTMNRGGGAAMAAGRGIMR